MSYINYIYSPRYIKTGTRYTEISFISPTMKPFRKLELQFSYNFETLSLNVKLKNTKNLAVSHKVCKF